MTTGGEVDGFADGAGASVIVGPVGGAEVVGFTSGPDGVGLRVAGGVGSFVGFEDGGTEDDVGRVVDGGELGLDVGG